MNRSLDKFDLHIDLSDHIGLALHPVLMRGLMSCEAVNSLGNACMASWREAMNLIWLGGRNALWRL